MIRSKDEAGRLRLALTSLAQQSGGHEVVVVNDGSSDQTDEVIRQASQKMALTVVRHAQARGRSAAANAGAKAACGEILLFMDGDVLSAPDLLLRHQTHHSQHHGSMARGENWHLRCTRLLSDPESGLPFPSEVANLVRRPSAEIEKMKVTSLQILQDFEQIHQRASLAIYPGIDPLKLYQLEMHALEYAPQCPVLWAAAAGQNFSMPRDVFLQSGGFDEAIDSSEHRELALRVMQLGYKLMSLPFARSYHMTHRSGWRDPLKETAWEKHFLARHPLPAVALLPVFWGTISMNEKLPPAYRIHSLPELAAAAQSETALDYDHARECLGLSRLGQEFWVNSEK